MNIIIELPMFDDIDNNFDLQLKRYMACSAPDVYCRRPKIGEVVPADEILGRPIDYNVHTKILRIKLATQFLEHPERIANYTNGVIVAGYAITQVSDGRSIISLYFKPSADTASKIEAPAEKDTHVDINIEETISFYQTLHAILKASLPADSTVNIPFCGLGEKHMVRVLILEESPTFPHIVRIVDPDNNKIIGAATFAGIDANNDYNNVAKFLTQYVFAYYYGEGE